jgi:hypothetical protein
MSSLFLQYMDNTSGEFVHTQVSGLSKALQLCSCLNNTLVSDVKVYTVKADQVITLYALPHATEQVVPA